MQRFKFGNSTAEWATEIRAQSSWLLRREPQLVEQSAKLLIMTNRQIPPSYEAGLGSLALVHPTVLRAYRALNQTAVAFSLYPPPPAA